MINKIKKIASIIAIAAVVIIASSKTVKADELTDALLAQQAVLYQQQLEMLQNYQAAVLAQYQQAIKDQYEKAVLVQQAFAKQQQAAVQQAYLLNAIQAQQNAQYQSMITASGLDYQGHLLAEYKKYQEQAKTAFLGYEGLK
ncbi:MAG: hypothetical protein Q4E51_00225 [Lachnospiraceae bacterium]|nr:hypothetical protein [Lachnospiraceae bacterium]